MEKERKVKGNIFMRIAAVLFCATLFSMYLVSGLYARYTTSTINNDSARVAEFNITQEGTFFEAFEANIIPGETQGADLTITNKSEVAMEYTLTVTNVTGNLEPLKFTLYSVDGTITPVSSESHENGISKYGVTQIPGEHTDKYRLNIIWEPSDKEKALESMGMVDYITVSVTATQVD